MKSPSGFGVFLGVKFKKKLFFYSIRPNHAKHLLSGLNELLKGNFRSLGSAPGDPRGACCTHFRSENCPPPISVFVR
jgi:hypothetical protein